MLKKLLFGWGVLVGLSSIASATPFIGLDDPCNTPAVALTPGTPMTLTNGGGVNCFYNPLDQFITDIAFQTTLNPDIAGLLPLETNPGPSYPIQCDPINFFKSCSLAYDSSSGLLTIRFFDVNPADPLTDTVTDPETGPDELEGIPTLMPGCTNDQGSSSIPGYDCSFKGTFLITLNDTIEGYPNENPNNPSGSWNTVGVPDGNVFTTLEVNGVTAPEPSTLILFGVALLGLFSLPRARARQRG